MAITVNLSAIFLQEFGIKLQPPKPKTGVNTPQNISGINVAATTLNAAQLRTSLLGTPIFESTNFSVLNQSGSNLQPLLLPDAMVIDVNRAKEIVKTAITKRDGKVKEYIGLDDYIVQFRGVIVNFNSEEYPSDDVKALRAMLEVADAIQVTNQILNDVFLIHNLVIEDFDFPRIEATPNVQPFTIKCCSDEPIELTLKQNNLIN